VGFRRGPLRFVFFFFFLIAKWEFNFTKERSFLQASKRKDRGGGKWEMRKFGCFVVSHSSFLSSSSLLVRERKPKKESRQTKEKRKKSRIRERNINAKKETDERSRTYKGNKRRLNGLSTHLLFLGVCISQWAVERRSYTVLVLGTMDY